MSEQLSFLKEPGPKHTHDGIDLMQPDEEIELPDESKELPETLVVQSGIEDPSVKITERNLHLGKALQILAHKNDVNGEIKQIRLGNTRLAKGNPKAQIAKKIDEKNSLNTEAFKEVIEASGLIALRGAGLIDEITEERLKNDMWADFSDKFDATLYDNNDIKFGWIVKSRNKKRNQLKRSTKTQLL